MKNIAITQQVILNPFRKERLDALDQRWILFLAACNLIPIILPNHPTQAKKIVINSNIQGILLTGGNSLVCYNGDAAERDAMENDLVEFALLNDIPLLGVCRGMQILQNYFGVPLYPIENHVQSSQQIEMNGKEIMVNSYHCWGTTQTVPELLIWAKSQDQIVKAFKHVNKKIVGIMWHPERMEPHQPHDIDLFENFFR